MTLALLTGATGFIGRHLANALTLNGREFVGLGRAAGDIRRAETFEPFLDAGVSTVFHLAARSFVPDSWADPAGFAEVNVHGTARALEFCRATGARMVYVSAYLYGVPERLPIAETAPVKPNNPYALSKHLAEQLCAFFAANYSTRVCVIRPFNVYGPDQDHKFLIPSVLAQLHEVKANGGPAIEVMDLTPRRDLVFVDDVVEALEAADAWLEAAESAHSCEIFNIGNGVSHSVEEIAAIIQQCAGTAYEVRSHNSRRINEIPDVVADITKARAILGWSPRTSLAQGIRKCLTNRP